MLETTRYDVVVVGAGPAGLAAALEAGQGTSSVAVIDQNPHPGGQIWRHDVRGPHSPRAQGFESRVSERATFINSATVVDAFTEHGRHSLTVEQSGASVTLETGTLILATGARELFVPFPGWTLPGVVGVGGLQALMKSGLDVSGKRIVLAGTGPLVLAVAATAAQRGADIVAVVEQASLSRMLRFSLDLARRPLDVVEAARFARHIPPGALRLGAWITSAEGRGGVKSVTIKTRDGESQVACDYLACAYGLVPNIEMARLLGCAATGDGIIVDDSQQTTVPGVYAAGECTGIAGVNKSLAEGLIAGRRAVGLDVVDRMRRWRAAERRWGHALNRAFSMRPEVLDVVTGETIVCRCEDVRMHDALSAGASRSAKLYHRIGMGPCQGRICGAFMRLHGWDLDTPRPPIHPAALSSLLGAS